MAASTRNRTILPERLASLDALRGFDMFWIMGADELVHEWSKISGHPFSHFMAVQMDHAEWHGFTAYDLIFPLFLFIAGVATPYSIGREIEKGVPRQKLALRVIKRGLLLALLGFIYNNGLAFNPFEKLRFASVLGRIGFAYLFANLIFLYAGKKARVIWAASLLLGYWLLLKFSAAPGFPPGDWSMEGNFASYFDRLFLPGSLYLGIHDPEGILSTIPAISTGLLGNLYRTIFERRQKNAGTKGRLFVPGRMGASGGSSNLEPRFPDQQKPLDEFIYPSNRCLQFIAAVRFLLCYRCFGVSKMGILFPGHRAQFNPDLHVRGVY